MDHPLCDHPNCIHWKDGRCELKDPEKEEDHCLNFEDAMDSLRLKADALKGTLSGASEFLKS